MARWYRANPNTVGSPTYPGRDRRARKQPYRAKALGVGGARTRTRTHGGELSEATKCKALGARAHSHAHHQRTRTQARTHAARPYAHTTPHTHGTAVAYW